MSAQFGFRHVYFGLSILVAFAVCSVPASTERQRPTLDSIEILPPPPILRSDTVDVNVSGTVNINFPVFHSFWQQTGFDIQIDVVDVEDFNGPPGVRVPYLETVSIGSLSPGDYDLTVRLFWTFDGEGAIPIPWEFPDAFGKPFDELGPLVLQSSFTVVPEAETELLTVLCLVPLVLLLSISRGAKIPETPGDILLFCRLQRSRDSAGMLNIRE